MTKEKRFLLLIFWCCILSVHAEKRLALVIGNSEYGKQNYLENPVHDAEDIAAKLSYLGFDVIKLTDGILREMHETISDFGEKAKTYDVVLFYYSGHGLQTKGENYLMPIDAELRSEADVKYACLPLNLLLDKLEESGCPMKIVVLDACRNNPFSKRWYRGDRDQGLASVSPPKGTYITFSTAAGSVALDGTGRNSPYTTAFLETLDIPNLSLFDFFNEVGQKVLSQTNNEQDPWTNHNTMKGKFFFNLSSNSRIHFAHNKTISIIPQWVIDKNGNEYVGVSVPIEDKDKAKREAILNALLKYMFFEGEVETTISGEVKMKNIQTKIVSDFVLSEERISFDVMSKLLDIDIEIKNEFYNNNNEYFVLCSFRKNSKAQNGVLVKRKLQLDELRKSVYVVLSVDAFIDNEETRIDYDFVKSTFMNGRHHLLIDSVDVVKQKIEYKNYSSGADKDYNVYPLIEISECGSLGMAELAFLAQMPVITDSINVSCMVNVEQNGNANYIWSTQRFFGSAMSRPVNSTIYGIKDKHLCISISDPYDSFHLDSKGGNISSTTKKAEDGIPPEFYDVIRENTIEVESSIIEGEPLLLKKSLGMYVALGLLCNKNSESTISYDGNNNSERSLSKSNRTFSRYYPFFFLDGEHSDLRTIQNGVRTTAVLTY